MNPEAETYIKNAFDNILSNYLLARFEPFGREHALWRVFEGLSNQFQEHIKNQPTLKVKWGVGKGNWARVPWIAFLGNWETESIQDGVYPVYLFREDMSGVYITLNQGVTTLKARHGTPEGRNILRRRAKQLRLSVEELGRA